MINELKTVDVSFEAFELDLFSRIFRTFYDWFLYHYDDGTAFPAVGTIFLSDLLEYEKRGGSPVSICSKAIDLAHFSFLRS